MATSESEPKFLIRGDRLILFLDLCTSINWVCGVIERVACHGERGYRIPDGIPGPFAWSRIRPLVVGQNAQGHLTLFNPLRELRSIEDNPGFVFGVHGFLAENRERIRDLTLDVTWWLSRWLHLSGPRSFEENVLRLFGRIATGELTEADLVGSDRLTGEEVRSIAERIRAERPRDRHMLYHVLHDPD